MNNETYIKDRITEVRASAIIHNNKFDLLLIELKSDIAEGLSTRDEANETYQEFVAENGPRATGLEITNAELLSLVDAIELINVKKVLTAAVFGDKLNDFMFNNRAESNRRQDMIDASARQSFNNICR